MKYLVHTDGAADSVQKLAGMAFVINTNTKFIVQKCYKSEGNSSTDAEAMAVSLASKWLLSNIDLQEGKDFVLFYVDNQLVIDTLKTDSSKLSDNLSEALRMAYNDYNELRNKVSTSVIKTWGHKSVESLNGNKVADRIAKYALRSARLSTSKR